MMPNETKLKKKSLDERVRALRDPVLAEQNVPSTVAMTAMKKAVKPEKELGRGPLLSNLRPRTLLDKRIVEYEDAKAELRQLKYLLDSRLDLTRAQDERRKELEDELMYLCGELRDAAGWYGQQAERITNLLNASAEADIAKGPGR